MKCAPHPRGGHRIEDRCFYSHFGVDPIGLSGAMVTTALAAFFARRFDADPQ
jgi:hypothetical protein